MELVRTYLDMDPERGYRKARQDSAIIAVFQYPYFHEYT